MPTEGIGVYGLGTAALLNTEISSTYEGRHLTFLEADITGHEHGFPTKGHPVVISDIAPAPDHGDIVGVALTTATAIGDYVAIDTEGIWYLSVSANVGEGEVRHGDKLFINRSSALISNDDNKDTNAHFGYALGGVTAGAVATIAVKVHWDPSDMEEKVGTEADEFDSAAVSKVFREYYYSATGGSYITANRMHLVIPSTASRTYTATTGEFKLTIPGDVWVVTGNAAVIEAYLAVEGAAVVNMRTQSCLQLGFLNQNLTSVNNYSTAYISLRDDTVDTNFSMNRLLVFHDIAAIPDADVAPMGIIADTDTTVQPDSDVRIRCGYGPTAQNFWIMCTTTPPD